MMKLKKYLFTLLILPCFMRLAHAGPVPDILSPDDAALYAQIFDLQRREKIDAAQKLDGGITNPLLMNEVLYQRYMSKTYRTRGVELTKWMEKYYNMPGADTLQKLAARKKAAARTAYLPRILSGGGDAHAQSESWTKKAYAGDASKKITAFKNALRRGNTKNARAILEDKNVKKKLAAGDYGRLAGRLAFVYYADGNMDMATKWGTVAAAAKSEYGLWTMGLLSYKKADYDGAQKYFVQMLDIDQINDARKTEIAFWAGMAADNNGDAKTARDYWKMASVHPRTFYGALATAKGGDTPRYDFFDQGFSDDDIAEIGATDYGARALALLQIEERAWAEKYMRYMVTGSSSDRLLHAVYSVASAAELPRLSMQVAGVIKDRGIIEIDENVIFAAQYPLPDWEPMGGWGLDRALLFAITRQESGFETNAQSHRGASGVMQLMPGTARIAANGAGVSMADIDISNPEHNLFLGQQHITDLFGQPGIDNDIIKMLVSYNSGAGAMAKFEQHFQTDDPLLYIESFPNAETRTYVKRVISNLWLYRARLSQPLSSISNLANGEWPKYETTDEFVQQQLSERGQL